MKLTQYKNLVVMVVASALTTGCFTQKPAPVEDKSNYVFRSASGKNPQPINQPAESVKPSIKLAKSDTILAEDAASESSDIEVKVSSLKPTNDVNQKELQSNPDL